MALSGKIPLLVVLVAIACGTVSAQPRGRDRDLSRYCLPLLKNLPDTCGYVLGVVEGDTCESLAAFGNIDMATYTRLNPLALCGILKPAPGSVVCVGDKMATCSNVHRGVAGETCRSIEAKFGAIIGGNVRCSGVVPDTPICVRPGPNKCDVDSLCGVPLTDDMRDMLGRIPDWCTVLRECQAPLSATTTNGLPSVSITLTDITSKVAQVADNDGHPELAEFVKQRNTGPVTLQISFVPNAQGDGMDASNFVIAPGGTRRKLLATAVRGGQPGTAAIRYY